MATSSKSSKPKNVPDATKSVQDVLATIGDESTLADSTVLAALMKKITGNAPKVWNQTTIGFDSYHFKYESGREGDSHVLAFNPRKGKFTIYLMDGCARYAPLLEKLGKHTTSRVCIYFKRLSELNLDVLEQILQASCENVKSQDGRMQRVES